MKTNFEKVREFNQAFGVDVGEWPEVVDSSLRLSLIREELTELENELSNLDDFSIEKVAKELTDLLYVVYGAGVAWGIDLDACMEEVHASNMTKLDENGKPIYRHDGKVLKGPNYRPADLSKIIR